MKILLTFILLLLGLESFSATILIDPGHGGEDTGASNTYHYWKKKKRRKLLVHEKDIALQLAKRIHKKLIDKKYSSYLTRSIDRTVTLGERAELAEKVKADLFISLHFNSSTRRKPNGYETYYLDNHKDGAVQKLEAAENRDLKGQEYVIHHILTDLVIQQTVEASRALASSIHSQVHHKVGKPFKMINRGIKPGLFYVLALAKRPAVLLEVGFMSNQKELKKMRSSKFQNKFADAVVKGIEKYLKTNLKKKPSLF